MTRRNLLKSLAKASKTTGVILLLIGVSNMLRYQMAYLEIPDTIEAALLAATTTPWLMLLYINIIQIFLGIFLDMAAHILITTPLFLPAGHRDGRRPGAVRHDAAAEAARWAWCIRPSAPCSSSAARLARSRSARPRAPPGPTTRRSAWRSRWWTYVPSFSTWLPTLITGHVVL